MTGHNPILDGLNEAQRMAVTLGDGPILVIAGAGTGKTRTLVHRVAHLVSKGVHARSILLLTFTRRAAEEMLFRARELDPACGAVSGGTFHSVAMRILRRFGSGVGLAPGFSIIDPADTNQIIKQAVDELKLKQKGDKRFPRARSIADIISKSRNLELSLSDTIEEHAEQFFGYTEEISKAAGAFQQAKREQGLVDFDDLLFLTDELLAGDRGLRQKLSREWGHILVDEYQDTNHVQARILGRLTEEHANVMVVGDDAQSIYAFRGARLANIMEFPKNYPETRLVKLEENYRSTQPILNLTNQVIAQASERYEKNLFTSKSEGVLPELIRPRDQKGQSRKVVERIRDLKAKGAELGDMAVIFRAGRDSFDLETELKANHLSYVKYGGIRFVELAHVKDVMAHLRVLANPMDFLSWQRILTLLPKIGPKTAQVILAQMVQAGGPDKYIPALAETKQAKTHPKVGKLAQFLADLAREEATPLEMVEETIDYYEPILTENHENYPQRLKDLKELPGMAAQSASLQDFLAETVLDPPNEEIQGGDGSRLTLTTAHSAKGKEWPHVLVIWAGEGRFPAFPSMDNPQAIEEERRLMYVACTRAGESLTIFSPREHYFEHAGFRPVELSRFLEDLPQDLMKLPQKAPVFPVPEPGGKAAAGPAVAIKPAPPVSRGSKTQNRPFRVGAGVKHEAFGIGKVMGYKGNDKIFINFKRFGLKTLLLKVAKLEEIT